MKVLIVEDEKPIAQYIELLCNRVLKNKLQKIYTYYTLDEAASFLYPPLDWERGTRPDGTEIPRMKFEIQLVTASMLAQTNGLAELRQALSLPSA